GPPLPVADKGPSASLAPSVARSTYREYASRAAFGRRLAADPFSPTGDVDDNCLPSAHGAKVGGGGGIRTHGTVARTRHFQCRTFGPSATPPRHSRARLPVGTS